MIPMCDDQEDTRARACPAYGPGRTAVPKATQGWDNAKKVNGSRRHIAVDTTGLVLDVVITAASVQDRQAARPLLENTHRACRRVRLVWAEAGYAGTLAAWAQDLHMTRGERCLLRLPSFRRLRRTR